MAEPTKFVIGPGFRKKLESTIQKVDALCPGGPVKRIPTALEDGPSRGTASSLRLSKTTSTWRQDTYKRLTIWRGYPDMAYPDYGNEVIAWNSWADIGADEWVILGSVNSFWYVVERPNYGAVYHGQYSGSWGTGGTTNIVTEWYTGITYTVKNYLTPISGAGGHCTFGFAEGEFVLLSFDLTSLEGYTGATQILGVEGGSLKWFDTVICT
jgi:hypothetical protein